MTLVLVLVHVMKLILEVHLHQSQWGLGRDQSGKEYFSASNINTDKLQTQRTSAVGIDCGQW